MLPVDDEKRIRIVMKMTSPMAGTGLRQSVGAYVERWRPALCGHYLPAGHDLPGALCRRAAASGHEEREPDLCDTSGLCRQRTYSGRSAPERLTPSRHAVGL